ncbi:leucyl aminopeptidase [uncultured Bartonella sp.]|uniref:leucyl aminopeptidase n=1 Tax=uncultured Bartonella sp. TaxID=104108 RepID=UPI00262D950E|nr:leucyl aminopeptidase [uncultured Bartonella sp.]
MARNLIINSSAILAPKKTTVVALVNEKGKTTFEVEKMVGKALIDRIIAVREFKGKKFNIIDEVCDGKKGFDRLILLGVGKPENLVDDDYIKLGGAAAGALENVKEADIYLTVAGEKLEPENIEDFILGLRLRSYQFDRYKEPSKHSQEKSKTCKITIGVEDPNETDKLIERANFLADAVLLARDLVNEPANVLGTKDFVKEVQKLEKIGVNVEILDEKDMKKLGMGALLGVARGSKRPPYIAIMQWHGGKPKDRPLAFVGKGVVFDSGGISLKPGAGMEDMKGDMGGAAAVTGLMKAVALQKMKANIVGVIGLVENMPDGNAQRPGDIVTSMSGQTIEVINTDAEGRLVLSDALWYTKQRFTPKIMVDLATLTGAIMVALGRDHAGLFSNNDALADHLLKSGLTSGEKLWRMPLNETYDKMVDSKVADMKNSCGRHAGAVTAAQFLQRFVGDTPWAHLDIAGTAMDSPVNEYNRSWASGFGVRLLDRLIKDYYEV